MKTKVNIVLLLIIILLGVLYYQSNTQAVNRVISEVIVNPSVTPTITPTPTVTLTPTPTIAFPKQLIIPKLNLQSSIEFVNMDDNGKMGIPTSFDIVGWYSFGAKPGETGSAVIDGHYDTTSGSPAIFYNLNSLELGDDIYIITQDNQKFHFIITKKENYNLENIPLEDIFSINDNKYLNLITCNGIWNNQTQSYSHRTVIFSKLAN